MVDWDCVIGGPGDYDWDDIESYPGLMQGGGYAGNFVPHRAYTRWRPEIKADFKSKQAQQRFAKYAKEK